ncbi:hypothetical protein ACFE04_015472 [Oxalis oulophora]
MEIELNLKATELRLGLPGRIEEELSEKPLLKNFGNKRPLEENDEADAKSQAAPPPPKAQVVGWPPIRSYRKNSFQKSETEFGGRSYVKVSLDGAPYLRKIDLKSYNEYGELLLALEKMFKFTYEGSGFVTTYEDKDGDWMLVGDVPWDMFLTSCKRLRIMKGSDAKGLGCGV